MSSEYFLMKKSILGELMAHLVLYFFLFGFVETSNPSWWRNRRHIYKWESSKPKAITTYVIMWLIKRSVDKHMFVINMLLDI